MKILITDDDTQILRALKITVGARGYTIVTAHDGVSALNQAIAQHPDIVLLDLGMPGLDGIGVIHAIRGWSDMPILVISGRTGEASKIDALDAGADDYVTKPFSIDELLARIRALTRRAASADDTPVIVFGNISVDLAAKSITRRTPDSGTAVDTHETVRLTPTEWRILELLLRNPGKLVTREAVLTQVWGANHTNDSGYLRLYIGQLRKKLEPEPSRPRFLLTESGMGYRFAPAT